MFSKPLDPSLKAKYYDDLTTDPELNVPKLLATLEKEANLKNFDRIKEVIRVLKFMIKDKISARPKFYALILIKELMELRKPEIVEYFIKKLLDRFFQIAQFESKNPDINRGERCLKKYYAKDTRENLEFSLKFFMLLLECWSRWDKMFSAKYKKIKEKCVKLQQLFPKNEIHYDLMSKSGNRFSNSGIDTFGHNKLMENQEHMPLDDSMNSKPRVSAEPEAQPVNPKPTNSKPSTTTKLRTDLKELDASYEIRKCLREIMQPDNKDLFSESYGDFYQSIQIELGNLNKTKPLVAKSPAYKDPDRQQYNNEIAALSELLEDFDKYGRGELDFVAFGKNVAALEKKYPIPDKNNGQNNMNISFENNNQNFKIPRDEGFGNFGISEDQTNSKKLIPQKNKSPLLSPNAKGRTTHSNFETNPDFDGDDSKFGKNSIAQMEGSSRMITESGFEERKGVARNSIDSMEHSNANRGNQRASKGNAGDKFQHEGGEWKFGFDDFGQTDTQEDNGFGAFDGFGKEKTKSASRKESDKTPKKTASPFSKADNMTKEHPSSSKDNSPSFSQNSSVRKSPLTNLKGLKIGEDDGQDLPNTTGFAGANGRMNVINEDANEDFDDTTQVSNQANKKIKVIGFGTVKEEKRATAESNELSEQNQFNHDDEDSHGMNFSQPISRHPTRSGLNASSKSAGKGPNQLGKEDQTKNKFKKALQNGNVSLSVDRNSANQSQFKSEDASPHPQKVNTGNSKGFGGMARSRAQELKPGKAQKESGDPFGDFTGNSRNMTEFGQSDFELSAKPFKDFNQTDNHSPINFGKDNFQTANFNFDFENIDDKSDENITKRGREEFEVNETDNNGFGFLGEGQKLTLSNERRPSHAKPENKSRFAQKTNSSEGEDEQNVNFDFDFNGLGNQNFENTIASHKDKNHHNPDQPVKNSQKSKFTFEDFDQRPPLIQSSRSGKQPFSRQISFKSPNESEEPVPKSSAHNEVQFGDFMHKITESNDHLREITENESETYNYNFKDGLYSPVNRQGATKESNSRTINPSDLHKTGESGYIEHITEASAQKERLEAEYEKIKQLINLNENQVFNHKKGKKDDIPLQDEFDNAMFVQPNFNIQSKNDPVKSHQPQVKASLTNSEKYSFPPLSQSPLVSESPINFVSPDEEKRQEKENRSVKKVESQVPDNLVSLITKRRVDSHPKEVNETEFREISELKLNNEFLKQQCELLFNQLMEKQKAIIVNPSLMAITSTNTPYADLNEIETKIVQRKQDFLSKQNVMLKSAHDKMALASPSKRDPRKEQVELYGKLTEELKLYIQELEKELGSLIRTRTSQEQLLNGHCKKTQPAYPKVQLRD
jgi:hypothetical protein